MKYLIVLIICQLSLTASAQNKENKYPVPEFLNEIYYLIKDSMQLVRLEKNNADMETKTKLGGFAGAEFGYFIEGSKSTVRISGGTNLSFVFYTGANEGSNKSADSVMKENNMDPSILSYGSMGDPLNNAGFYKATSDKAQRKILLQSGGGMGNIGSKSKKESNKLSFSLKTIRPGYYELVIDKPLSKGEYAFTLMGMGNINGGVTIYSFGID